MHPLSCLQGSQSRPPQSTSVSYPSWYPFLHDFGVLAGVGASVTMPSVQVPSVTPSNVVVSHEPLAQSPSSAQVLPPLHGSQREPPQSVSVSPKPGSKFSFEHVSATHDVGALVGFAAPAIHAAFSSAVPSTANWKHTGLLTLIL